ncbi:MAG: hypothetical protein JNK82_09790 [Myxococcaceae bacterium]|nr:hypothetical protein [Myxococcaceae bacterium]
MRVSLGRVSAALLCVACSGTNVSVDGGTGGAGGSSATGGGSSGTGGGSAAFRPDSICPARGVCSELPFPTVQHLYGVHAASASEVWAVGESGTIVLFDGTRFIGVPRATPKRLIHVGVSPTYVWALGFDGALLRSRRDARPPEFEALDSGVVANQLVSFYASDDSHVWVGTDSGDILFWNGSGFTTQLQNAGYHVSLSGLSATRIWAVGSRTPDYHAWQFDGTTWHPRGVLSTLVGGPHAAVHAFADDDVWSNSFNGDLFHFDGGGWTNSGQNIYPVTGVTGFGGVVYYANGTSAQRLVNGTLSPLTLPPGVGWTGVSGSADAGLWAVGQQGSWAHGTPPALEAATPWQNTDGLAVIAGAGDEVVALGTRGLVRDAQGAWRPAPNPSRVPTDLVAFSETDRWAASAAGLARSDGGAWELVPTNVLPRALRGLAPNDLYVGGSNDAGIAAIAHWNGSSFTDESIDVTDAGPVVHFSGPAGNVWAITEKRSVLQRTPSGWVQRRAATSLGSQYAHVLVLGPNDVMAFFALATEHERWDGTSWSKLPRTPFGGPLEVTTTRAGAPLVASTDGIFVYRDGAWVGGGPSVDDVAEGAAGTFALGRGNGAVYRVDVEQLGR